MDQRIAARHFAISGYTQHRGRMSGLMRVSMNLEQALPSTHRVHLCRWNEDWWEWAEYVWLLWQEAGGPQPVINLYAYSYGMGWGAIQLSRELQRRGMGVNHIVSCDGVYRHPYRLGAWRALWPWSTILVPSNVGRVTYFYQRRNLPSGHEIVAEDSDATNIKPGPGAHGGAAGEIIAAHQYADDSTLFRSTAIEVARSVAA